MTDSQREPMSRLFKIDVGEGDDDAETRELDRKVEETLKVIAQISSGAPEALATLLASTLNVKRDASGELDWSSAKLEDMGKLFDGLKQAYKELPSLSTVLGHWTTTLSAYATYRSLKKQESLTEKILASNNLLARATVGLAIATAAATVVLAIFSANSLMHFLG